MILEKQNMRIVTLSKRDKNSQGLASIFVKVCNGRGTA